MSVLAAVDWQALWQTVWTAALGGISTTLVFSFAVLGATRSLDARRADRAGAASAYAVVALLGLAATIAAIVYAVTLIATK